MALRIPQNFQSPYDATSLITHLSGATITPAICAHITAAVGSTVIGITSYSSDLTGVPGYPGVTFKSTTGVTASTVEHADRAHPTNMEADLFLITAGITEADVLAGKWTHAACTIFLVNYEVLDMGQLIINKGFLSQFVQRGQMLSAEVRGFNQALVQQIGRVTRPECDADHGDPRCGRDLVALGEVKTVTVSSVTTAQLVFRDSGRTETGDYFDNAKGEWLTGNNAGHPLHVGSWDASLKEFSLRVPTPYVIQNGDTASINRGCRKREADCVARNNITNMRAFPHVPTLEDLHRLPLS